MGQDPRVEIAARIIRACRQEEVFADETAVAVIAALVRARERIGVEGRWTRGVTARDANRVPVPPRSKRATCWCFYGALIAAGCSDEQLFSIWKFLQKMIDGQSIGRFNDTHTHAEVIALLDRAISKLGDDHAG